MIENELSPRLSNLYSNEEIADSIGEIARENFATKHPISNEPKQITRRELVAILNRKYKDLNLADTLEVDSLVRLSYKMSPSVVQESIVKTLKRNIGNDSVYDPKRLYPSNHVSQFSKNEGGRLIAKSNLLASNATEINSKDSEDKIEITLATTQNLKFKKEFLGIGNAESAKEYAIKVLSGYESMIEEYDKIKNINLDLLNDFDILRNELKYEREDVVQLLMDLIGSRAKQQYPELFNFKQIEWLDFEKSWEGLNLSYNTIQSQHKKFLEVANIALKNFQNSISTESNRVFSDLKSKSRGKNFNDGDLIGAGAQIAFAAGAAAIKEGITTRNKSKEVVAMIQHEVEILKNKMTEDKSRIIGDIFRLGKIYSKLSHSFLPNYNEFINKNSELIVSELSPLYEEILQNPFIRSAKEENNQLIKRQRFLEQKNIDFNSNLEYSKEEEIRLGEILDARKDEYLLVLSLIPKKPFILTNIFTFGRSSKIFKRTMHEWNTFCEPIVDDFHYLQNQQNAETFQREIIAKHIIENKEKLSSLSRQISSNSEIIRTEFNKSPHSESTMIKLITTVKKIINASRNVLEIELDHDLQKEVVI